MALVETPQLPQKEASRFTPEQALQFLRTLDGNRIHGVFRVAVCLGMRQGEILLKHRAVQETERQCAGSRRCFTFHYSAESASFAIEHDAPLHARGRFRGAHRSE